MEAIPSSLTLRHGSLANRLAAGIVIVLLLLLGSAGLAFGADPSATPPTQADPDLHVEAHALLGGNVRPGSWAAVDIVLSNDGPPIRGEVRLSSPGQQGQSRYGTKIELANGARQHFVLYAQTALFGSKLAVDVVSDDGILASQQVAIRTHDAYNPIVAVVAERPELIVPALTAALTNPNMGTTSVITLGAADLPPRVEAWSAIDRLVWQDVDTASISADQREALGLWLDAGGELTVLGGTTGVASLDGFGDLLPFEPEHTIDAAPADLAALVGQPTDGAAALPALAGRLARGSVLATSGDEVIAARAGYGRGSVSLIGADPGHGWISEPRPAGTLWHRLMPLSNGPALNPLSLPDDSQIVYALQNLPSVDLPPIGQLLILLFAYIALIGPVNYLVLRRIDRREWAWVTIPALVVVFAIGSYGMGAGLKGSDVIVNQIAIVRAAQDSSQGIGQVYVGIYSPTRRTFDVSVPGGALISSPTSQVQQGQSSQPIDVLLGDSRSELRDFEVGFGVLRGFRAEAPAAAPLIDSNLRLNAGKLVGEIANRSDAPLENVAVLFGGAVATFDTLDPGASRSISLDTTGSSNQGYSITDQIFGQSYGRDENAMRTYFGRRSVIDQLFPYGANAASDAPLLLAWREGPVIDVELAGDNPNREGDGLFMIPLGVSLGGQQTFGDLLMRRMVIDTTASQGWADFGGMYLSRGTMTVELRPQALSGTFEPTLLSLAVTQGEPRVLRGTGEQIEPLPDSEQPDQDDPLESSASPPATSGPDVGTDEPVVPPPIKFGFDGDNGLPDFQLYDRAAGKWYEFAHPDASKSYVIVRPERYVDEHGAVLIRFINRTDAGIFGEDQRYFQLALRVEGSIR